MMTGAMTGFLVAVGATSAVCYALVTRCRIAAPVGLRGGSDRDAGSYTDDNGTILANWFVTNDHSAIDGSGNPVDAGGFDRGGSSAISAVGRKAADSKI
jgi:hypothetical protein